MDKKINNIHTNEGKKIIIHIFTVLKKVVTFVTKQIIKYNDYLNITYIIGKILHDIVKMFTSLKKCKKNQCIEDIGLLVLDFLNIILEFLMKKQFLCKIIDFIKSSFKWVTEHEITVILIKKEKKLILLILYLKDNQLNIIVLHCRLLW